MKIASLSTTFHLLVLTSPYTTHPQPNTAQQPPSPPIHPAQTHHYAHPPPPLTTAKALRASAITTSTAARQLSTTSYFNMPKDVDAPRPRKTTRRKKKAEGEPTQALSPYMWFAKENRPKVVEENPDASFGEIGRILVERYKALNEQDLAYYKKKAEEDKTRYKNEMDAFKAASGQVV